MTFLNASNLLISLLLYPYLIRILGKEAYGTYVFILSNIQFFAMFISFGFSMPALKKISLFPDDNQIKSQTISEVFTAKILLFLLSALVLALLILTISFVNVNAIFYIVIFSTLLIDILFPSWYFQGIQKMKFVTYVNLTLRILTIPFIFLFIKSPADLLKYTLIVSFFPLAGGMFSFYYLQIKEKVQIRFVALPNLQQVFADALPFFWTSAFTVLKKESLTLIIGTFFNMQSVALYDLADKIVNMPRQIVNSINAALFPKVIKNYNIESIKKIIRYETFMSLAISIIIAFTGYWIVLILGGKEMLAAYPLAIILSLTIYAWQIVGCYLNFVFIPHNKYYFITKNQFVALVSFFLFSFIGLVLSKDIFVLAIAFSLSALVEVVYCKYLAKKYQLL